MLVDNLSKIQPAILSHKCILALAITECLKESGLHAFVSLHMIYVYRYPTYIHGTCLCRIALDDDYVRLCWSSTNQEREYNTACLAIDYCNPSLMDRILATIATIKSELILRENDVENTTQYCT